MVCKGVVRRCKEVPTYLLGTYLPTYSVLTCTNVGLIPQLTPCRAEHISSTLGNCFRINGSDNVNLLFESLS